MFGRDGLSFTPDQFIVINNRAFSVHDIQVYDRYLHKMEKTSHLQLLVQENGIDNK